MGYCALFLCTYYVHALFFKHLLKLRLNWKKEDFSLQCTLKLFKVDNELMLIDKINHAISDFAKLIPEDMQQIKQDLETNLKANLNAHFSKLDLVTREEFDIQTRLLQRTRAKLDELQLKLDELEQQSENSGD